MSALAVTKLSKVEARELTDQVKVDAETLWRKFVDLYERGAHTALGYSSWDSYFKDEFGGEKALAYRMLRAGRVARTLEFPNGNSVTLNEAHARELTPLLKQPEVLREAWQEVTERNPSPTAADVREVVAERVGPMNGKETQNSEATKRKLHSALSSIAGYCAGIDSLNLARAISVATEDDFLTWEEGAADSIAALNRMRRALKEAQ